MPNQNPPNQNQNNQDPNQNQPVGTSPPVSFSPQADLPPFPSEFQNVTTESVVPAPNPVTQNPEVSETAAPDGSAAPPVPDISSIISSPKKKFGTGKIIATILSILLIVGGVGAGTYLVGQKQIFKQKASTTACLDPCTKDADCGSGNYCYKPATGCPVCKTTVPDTNIDTNIELSPVEGDETYTTAECIYKTPDKTYSYIEGQIVNQGCGASGCAVSEQRKCTCNDGGTWSCVCQSDTSCGGSGNTGSWPPNGAQCKQTNGTVGAIGGCVLYTCPEGCSGGCNTGTPAFYASCSSAVTALGKNCGQVDTVNTAHTYCYPTGGTYKDSMIQCDPNCTHSGGGDDTTTPTNPPVAPYCAVVKAYNSEWTLLSSSNLSTLTAESVVNFCVTGAATSGTFDKAKFTINSVAMPETTTKRPNSSDFCQTYTIPTGTTTVSVSAQIHHSTGWF